MSIISWTLDNNYPGNWKRKKNFDKRNASIILNKMIDNLDKRYFMNRKDEKNESAGAKSIR